MADRIMPGGITEMPGVEQLNAVLSRCNLAAKIFIVDRTAGQCYDRRKLADTETAAQVEARQCNLLISQDNAALLLDTARGEQPNITGISYTGRPQDIPHDQLVQRLAGTGFLEGDNPHEPCLALLADQRNVTSAGIVTPFADAPPLKIVYANMSDASYPFLVTVDAQAVWNRLPAPDGHDKSLDIMRADLIGRIFRELEATVNCYGRSYHAHNLWAFVGPGANDTYHVGRGSKYGKLISAHDWERFVTTKVVPTSLVGSHMGTPIGSDQREITSLRLRDWVHHLLTQVYDVPADQTFVLPHDTVTDDHYASARKGDHSNNAMLSVIREIG